MIKKVRRSLVNKIAFISLTGTLITCLVISILTFQVLYHLQVKNAYEIAQRDLRMTGYYMDTLVEKIIGVTDTLVFSDDIYKLLTEYNSEDIVKQWRLYSDVRSDILFPLQVTEEYEMEIFLVSNEYEIFTTYEYNYMNRESEKEKVTRAILSQIEGYDYAIPQLYIKNTVCDVFDNDMLTFIRPLYYKGMSLYGYAVIFIDSRFITDLLQEAWYEDNYQIAVINADDNIIIHSDDGMVGQSGMNMEYSREENIDFEWVTPEQNYNRNYRIVFGINSTKMFYGIFQNIFILIAGIIMVMLVMAAGQIAIEERAIRSLKRLSERIQKLADNNFGMQLPVEGTDEIADVTISINEMSKKLKEQIELMLAKEEENSRLKILIYQARLNPHFIFNTLNDIKWMVILGEKNTIIESLSKLGMILENSFRKVDGMVTVREEINMLQAYLDIEHMRYQGRFHVTFGEIGDIENLYIPVLLLQPMLENSIFYGCGYQRETRIEVGFKLEEKTLLLWVQDNGPGMSEEQIKEISEQRSEKAAHLGIQMSRKRIELMFGTEYGLKIRSKKGRGTRIEITVPIIREWNEGDEKINEKVNDCG